MSRATKTLFVVAIVVLAGCSGGGSDAAVGDAQRQAAGSGDGGDQVGVAVGGAQDANAFRRNVENGYVPQPTDLSYEGLFHDYYFDTGGDGDCEQRFCPAYSTAVVRDPLSDETERFVSVGLTTGLTESDVARDPINLVVVVDTSGSMDARFDEYHREDGSAATAERPTKMAVARQNVASLTDNLGAEDRFGVVTFDDHARTQQDLSRVDETNMTEVRRQVTRMHAGGGTDLDAGMQEARSLLDGVDANERQTRIVYLTDAQPNGGETSGPALGERVQEYADDGIHTTVIGVGVDFNSEFTDQVATTEGANYYAVDSPTAFDQRMDETFSYMVTPLAYNLTLRATGGTEGDAIEHVYGTPYDGGESAELMQVSTLFPSRQEDNRTEGGVILLELADGVREVELNATYEDPDGERHAVTRTVTADQAAPYYGSTGVRKAVALTEYANLLRNWMVHENGDDGVEPPGEDASVEHRTYADNWEQEPVDLNVSPPYDDRIAAFVPYFEAQMDALDADRMQQDLAVLEALAEPTGESTATGPGERRSETPTAATATAATPAVTSAGNATEGTASTGSGGAVSTDAGLAGGLGSALVLVHAIAAVLVVAVRVTERRQGPQQNAEVVES